MALFELGHLKPEIHPNSWVAPTASLIGQVVLEEMGSVWFGTTIRADHEIIRIGAGSNVQENCVFHIDDGYPLTVGQNCTIGHKVMLHGCTIGATTLIGMGAIILNGAHIGENCLIGAGSLIAENKVIPANSLVMGVPGKIVRQIHSKTIRKLEQSALHYQQQMVRYRKDLFHSKAISAEG
ncbi:MAG: gamma carbonic anhydrase family protein [Aestuariivita sp.]|nr:gamma carbonic anhydrase family protein [Aestuariivita sp.]